MKFFNLKNYFLNKKNLMAFITVLFNIKLYKSKQFFQGQSHYKKLIKKRQKDENNFFNKKQDLVSLSELTIK